MKTEYIPIAMRCTQEQFNSIKDRINMNIFQIGDFEDMPYLVNNYHRYNGDVFVSNLCGGDILPENVHETFDGELFLDCCGREKLQRPCKYQDLFNYMSQEHGVDLLESDLNEIERLVLKDKVWKGSEIKANFGHGWEDVFSGYEYRIKPKPDYTAEIEALENKAKENGQKVIIKFE